MRTLLIDPFSGIAGDMLTAALLDVGAECPEFHEQMATLKIDDCSITSEKVVKSGITATKYNVSWDHDKHPHRHLSCVTKIINDTDLPDSVKTNAIKAFTILAEAEAKVHGTTIEKIHFHEVGAVDAIADITGACLALEYLKIDKVVCNTIYTGGGTVNTAHGILPVPAPATAEMLKGLPSSSGPAPRELATPTGLAITRAICSSFNATVSGEISAIGYGAGTLEFATHPNVLKVCIYEDAESTSYDHDEVYVIETDIDDMTGELAAATAESLMNTGALDALYRPCYMKKGRPGMTLQVICLEETKEKITQLIFEQTTTFGLRIRKEQRIKLFKEITSINTKFGDIGVKLGLLNNKVIKATPEYSDCVTAAENFNVSVQDVYLASLIAAGEFTKKNTN